MASLVDQDGLYAGPIVDAHHHWWDPALGRYPWLKGKDGPVLGRACLPEDYLKSAEGYNLVASVHVEANWDPTDPLGEIDWLDALSRPDGIAGRYVAYADLAKDGVEADLEQLAARERVVGIRDIVSWHPDPARTAVNDRHKMLEPKWRNGLERLAKLDLSFDLLMSPWQTDDALDLVNTFPDIRFVINHCGSPFDRSEEGMASWAAGLKRLARAPNVWLKISDLVAYDPDWSAESLSRVSLACLDAFGPERAMLASDHPVVMFGATFRQTYEHFRSVFAGLSEADQYALFAGNAASFYKLPNIQTRWAD
ncbi:MAG: amidohydrolase family protein [Rhizobiaceae bacterium]